MDKLTDNYIEYKEVFGSPQDIMAKYAEMVNAAFRENRMGMSKRWGEVMELEPRAYWLEEIGSASFVCICWQTTRYRSKEDFFADEQAEETIE